MTLAIIQTRLRMPAIPLPSAIFDITQNPLFHHTASNSTISKITWKKLEQAWKWLSCSSKQSSTANYTLLPYTVFDCCML